MRRVRRLAVSAALLALSGCVGGGAPSPFSSGVSGERSIHIEVRNLNFSDATVYAIRGAERVRLGVVIGKTNRDYEIDWPSPQTMRVEINLLAGERCTTRPRSVSPGDVISIQVPIDLRGDPDCT